MFFVLPNKVQSAKLPFPSLRDHFRKAYLLFIVISSPFQNMSFHRICFAQPWSSPGNEAFWLFRGGWTPERQQDLFCEHFTAIMTKGMSLRKTCEMHSNPFISPGTTWTWCFCWGPFEIWLTSQNQTHLIQTQTARFWTDVWSSHRLTSWYPYQAVFPSSRIRILSLPSLTMFDSWMWVIHWHWFNSTDFGFWEEWAALEQRNLKNRWSPPEDSTALLALEAAGYQDMHECKPKLKHESST